MPRPTVRSRDRRRVLGIGTRVGMRETAAANAMRLGAILQGLCGCTATLVVSAERWRVLRDTAAARQLSMTTAQRTAHELQMRGSVAADLGGQPQRAHPEL